MRKITSEEYTKTYDEHINSQGLQFQIDNYYEPKNIAMKQRIELIMAAINPGPYEKILDIGCGVGTFAFHCAKLKALTYGIDYSSESIKTAVMLAEKFKTDVNSTFVVGNAIRLPFEDSYFDKIVSADFIEHISLEEKQHLLEEIYRVLKPNGIAVIFTPNGFREKIGEIYWKIRHFLLGDKIPVNKLHFGLTNKFQFEKLLRNKGFSFDFIYKDITRPYLAKLPFFRIFLSLNLLWVIKR